jgi:hypothetical protein
MLYVRQPTDEDRRELERMVRQEIGRTPNRISFTISGPSGHQNGHCLHKFGVHRPEGIHKDTSGHRFCARSCSVVIQQGFRSAEGLAQWLPKAMQLARQVKAAETAPEPFCGFRRS